MIKEKPFRVWYVEAVGQKANSDLVYAKSPNLAKQKLKQLRAPRPTIVTKTKLAKDLIDGERSQSDSDQPDVASVSARRRHSEGV